MALDADNLGFGLDEEPLALVKKRSSSEEADIDITPMIDMVFLLLIFFLVASTPDRMTAVELPVASHGIGVSQVKATVFTIGDTGLDVAPVYAGDGKIAGTELSDNLEVREQEIRKHVEDGLRENKTDVIIKADRGVAHREVSRVIKAVSKVDGIQLFLGVSDEQ